MGDDGEPSLYHHRDDQGNAFVCIGGEVDVASVDRLAAALDAAVAGDPSRIVIDLTGTTFMDGSAVSRIIELRRVVPQECPIVLLHPRPIVLRLMSVLGLDGFLTVEQPLGEGDEHGERPVLRPGG